MTSSLIDFLDTLGQRPPGPDFEARVAALDVDAPLREALIGRDADALARAFGEAPERDPDERPEPDPST